MAKELTDDELLGLDEGDAVSQPPAQEPYNDDVYGNDPFGGDFLGSPEVPGTMEKYNDLLKQLTNFNPYIRDKVNGWLGLVWDENKETYVPSPDIPPVMNQKGAQWCIDFLRTYTRGNNIITDISKEQYIWMVEDIIECIWLNLGTRQEDFQLIEPGDLLRVANELQHAAELVLMGAGDGKYNRLLSTTTSRQESLQLNPYQQQQQPNQFNAQPYGLPNPQQQPGKVGLMGKMKHLLIGGQQK